MSVGVGAVRTAVARGSSFIRVVFFVVVTALSIHLDSTAVTVIGGALAGIGGVESKHGTYRSTEIAAPIGTM